MGSPAGLPTLLVIEGELSVLVEMTLQIQGSRDGVMWPPPGACIDVGETEADDLVLAGYAVVPSKGAKEWDANTIQSGTEAAAESDSGTTGTVDAETTIPKATRKK